MRSSDEKVTCRNVALRFVFRRSCDGRSASGSAPALPTVTEQVQFFPEGDAAAGTMRAGTALAFIKYHQSVVVVLKDNPFKDKLPGVRAPQLLLSHGIRLFVAPRLTAPLSWRHPHRGGEYTPERRN